MTDTILLRAAIEASGLTERQFALRVLDTPPSTLSRWLSGTHPMRGPARQLVRALAAHPRLWRELARVE